MFGVQYTDLQLYLLNKIWAALSMAQVESQTATLGPCDTPEEADPLYPIGGNMQQELSEWLFHLSCSFLAAVVKPASYRILFALAAIYSWRIHQADVKTAFLNSSLPKPVHMWDPKGIDLPRGMCFLVLRAIYGLKQSP